VRASACKEYTLKDIARLARVSVSTVSRSLNDSPLISERTRVRIRRIAERKGFEFNAHARSLVTRHVGTIGIILPSDYERFSVNLYHGTLHNALRDVLERSDIDLIVTFLANRFTGRDNVRKLVTRKKVDGLIIVHPVPEGGLVDFLRSAGIPFVFSHYPPPPGCRRDVDLVYPDNELGGYLAARRLVAQGRKRLACVATGGDPDGPDAEYALRLEGFRRGLAVENGWAPIVLAAQEPTIGAGHDAIRALGSGVEEIDGVFAMNDLLAMGALTALRERGRTVPGGVAVIGYDDTELAASMRPALTTIHQPREELSTATCEMLVDLIARQRDGTPPRAGAGHAGRRVILSPTLVARETG
jgi:LacI family transcriptional regulator